MPLACTLHGEGEARQGGTCCVLLACTPHGEGELGLEAKLLQGWYPALPVLTVGKIQPIKWGSREVK